MAGKHELVGENLRVSMKLLHDATTVLERAGIPYWLEGGTLLGVVREQRLLPWDTDMDISLDKRHQWRLIRCLWRLALQGYRVTVKNYRQDVGPFRRRELRIVKIRNYVRFLKKGDAVLDVFLKKQVDDRFYWTVGDKKPVLKYTPAAFYTALTTVPFNGKEYGAPQDTAGYLTYRYGDWRTPVKTWDFKRDDRAIAEPVNPS